MGSEEFESVGRGDSVDEAFQAARAYAAYMFGHGGYTGTLAEKSEYQLIVTTVMTYGAACELARKLIEDEDERIDDKWGPAGAIEVHSDSLPTHVGGAQAAPELRTWLFFGWASS